MDVPKDVLGQLGLKVQHALRAFTAADRKVIKQTAENYPETEFYKTDELLTQLGIGEAIITMLNEKGIPTPLAHILLTSPRSRMDILTEGEISALISGSKLVKKYNQEVDSESAYELLTAKLEEAAGLEAEEEAKKQAAKATKSAGSQKEEKSVLEKMLNSSAGRQATRTLTSTITRTLLGALGLGGRSSKKKSLW
jgi:predicted flap endonuclease-1-like 5' DNA nuclease